MMKIQIKLLTFFSMLLFSIPNLVVGQDLTITPTFDTGGIYNNNLKFDKKDEELSVSAASVTPGLIIVRKDENFIINSKIELEILRFEEDKEFNSENIRYRLDVHREFLEKREGLLGSFVYVQDSAINRIRLPGEIYKTNEVNDRQFYLAEMGFYHKLTDELTSLGINGRYSQTNYSATGIEKISDEENYSVSIYLDRNVGNFDNLFKVKIDYNHENQDTLVWDNHEMYVGWSHYFSKLFSFNLLLGARYTDFKEQPEDSEDVDPWGTVAYLGIEKKSERVTHQLQYRYRIESTNRGETVVLHGLFYDIRAKLTERLDFGFLGYGYIPTGEGDFDFDSDDPSWDIHSTYFELGPSLHYWFTEHHNMEVAGDYTLYPDADRQRTRFWVLLNFSFPRKY